MSTSFYSFAEECDFGTSYGGPKAAKMRRSISDDSSYYSWDSPGSWDGEYEASEGYSYTYKNTPSGYDTASDAYASSQAYSDTYDAADFDLASPTSSTYYPTPENPLYFESKKPEYVCLQQGCVQKPFSRSADLARHYQQVHHPDRHKENFLCDYRKCARAGAGDGGDGDDDGEGAAVPAFHRKDHFRDHLRDFHKEDIPKRPRDSAGSSGRGSSKSGRGGSSGGGSSSSEGSWMADRHVDTKWWRCSKCLKRIRIADYRWECPDCKVMCEKERQRVRLEKKDRERRGA